MPDFSPAPGEVITIAEQIVHQHGEVSDLNLGFLMRDQAAVSKGRKLLAKVYKPPAWSGTFGVDYDLIVELPLDVWQDLVSHQREALVDYALSHINAEYDPEKGVTRFSLLAPDVQAFRRNLAHYGLWMPEFDSAAGTFERARQIQIPGMEIQGRLESIKGDFVEGMKEAGFEPGSYDLSVERPE